MQPILTTITSAWNRPEALDRWIGAIHAATLPEVRHFLYLPGQNAPSIMDNRSITYYSRTEPTGNSIGYYHDLGARDAVTEWIMKIDVDAIPHINFFKELIPILQSAHLREWFNCGMIHLNYNASLRLRLTGPSLSLVVYSEIMNDRQQFSASPYHHPSSTNFICRREDYLRLGGCDTRFKGWGWEDYQQIYMLERYQRGMDPLSDPVTLLNVTQKCRDEISRPKAWELFTRNPWLCLLHHWHPPSDKASTSSVNRQILFEYVNAARKEVVITTE